ncbi:hypothetical protein [Anaerosalibacter sp. Marseille-P3206]|uniref:hypothetical protein n=1 Tax=Anaerosalibacter sp. Marseille-P3206 TaxID=1871005 RepID=UPI00098507C8|nr:hypothetical protein [Anaerosalibacter sp. Marseille-P3206]
MARRYYIIGILIIIIVLLFIPKTKEEMYKYDNNSYISIHKNKITIYNDKNEEMDTLTLKEGIKEYSIPTSSQLVLLTGGNFSKYGKDVVVFSLDGEIKEMYREDFSRLKPWKITTGDIDGDGKCEVSIGVYKKTPFHQVMAKRPFIYSFENNKLVPKWRGSRLSKPFTDYDFCDIDGDGIDEIVSIEILEDNKKVINTYKWEGFGFEGFLHSKSFEDVKKLTVKRGIIYVEVKDKGFKYLARVEIENNNIKIERVN